MPARTPITRLLHAWNTGDAAARDAVMDALYADLQHLAARHLRDEPSKHSLPPSALVHEVFLRLAQQRALRWVNRAHFFGAAAHLMRRILVDRARHRRAARRNGTRVDLEEAGALCYSLESVDIIAVDRALEGLAEYEPRLAKVVELRFFAGLTVPEIATLLGVSPVTVKRDWAFARSWLYRNLRASP